ELDRRCESISAAHGTDRRSSLDVMDRRCEGRGMDRAALDAMAWRIAEEGIAAHEPSLAALVAAARTAGIAHTALDVLADTGAPEVARQRAFGLVASALTATSEADRVREPVGTAAPRPTDTPP